MDVLAGVASEYLLNVGRTIRFLCDKYAKKMTPEVLIQLSNASQIADFVCRKSFCILYSRVEQPESTSSTAISRTMLSATEGA